jgi:hypothetical protein
MIVPCEFYVKKWQGRKLSETGIYKIIGLMGLKADVIVCFNFI